MAFTRNWDKSLKLDHSKFKDQPGYVRAVMEDVEERLTAFLYGFASGETFTGCKRLNLITIGTGSGTIPTGTGSAAAINIQGKTIGSKVELITIDADGNEMQFTSKGNALANDAWLKATNLAGTAGINILKINTANQIEIGTGFGTHLVGPNTGPTVALQYAPKGYVDKEIITAALEPFKAGDWILSTVTTARTGWTNVSATYSNKFMRINATPLTTGGADTHTTPSHTLLTTEMPAHTHTTTLGYYGGTGAEKILTTATPAGSDAYTSASTGGGGGHTHDAADNVPVYVQVVCFQKN